LSVVTPGPVQLVNCPWPLPGQTGKAANTINCGRGTSLRASSKAISTCFCFQGSMFRGRTKSPPAAGLIAAPSRAYQRRRHSLWFGVGVQPARAESGSDTGKTDHLPALLESRRGSIPPANRFVTDSSRRRETDSSAGIGAAVSSPEISPPAISPSAGDGFTVNGPVTGVWNCPRRRNWSF